MFIFLKSTIRFLFISLVLITSNAWQSPTQSLPNQQLQGEAAMAFLAEAGILPQILDDVPLQGLPFPELIAHHATDYAADEYLGFAVALSEDTLIVGARKADVGGNIDQGAAYVFIRSGSTWSQQQKLVAIDGTEYDYFGFSVALDGDTALVGTWADVGDNIDQGSAYVFTRSGLIWSQQQKLVAADGNDHDFFGSSVALDGDTILIGAEYADVDSNSVQGAAYVFTHSGSIWSQQQKLVAADGASGDYFGDSVALDGNTALVGAYNADISGTVGQGAAYVFTRSDLTWSQQQKLVAADGAEVDSFGNSVALDGDIALVGAHKADVGDGVNQGAVYVFARSDLAWSQQQKLVAVDGNDYDSFGDSVALDGDISLVGAGGVNNVVENYEDQGSVYVFTSSGLTWSQQQKLVAADGAEYDYFGRAVASSNATALIGAYRAEVQNLDSAGKFYTTERARYMLFLPMVTR